MVPIVVVGVVIVPSVALAVFVVVVLASVAVAGSVGDV